MLSVEQAVHDIRRLKPGTDIAIDTETTGIDLYSGDVIRGISVAYRTGPDEIASGYFPISHPDTANLSPTEVRWIVKALEATDARHVFWNRNFDAVALAQVGLEPRIGEGSWYDGGTAAWLQNENDPKALKQQAAHWLGADADEEQRALKRIMAGYSADDLYARIRPGIRKGFARQGHEWSREVANASKKTWATLTGDDIAPYAAQDTVLTLEMAELQHQDGWLAGSLGTDPWPAMEHEFRVAEVVHRIVKKGVRVNLERARALALEYNARRAEIESEFGDVNLGSPNQLAKLVYKDWGVEPRSFTGGGQPSVDREALMELEGDHPGVALVLEHRARSKMVGTYLDPMNQWADQDERVHTSLNVTGTVTGRFSSSRPNLQNIPKASTDTTVKSLYVPSNGFELVEYDLHSAELFVGAAITGDTAMLAALTEPGRNFHAETADAIFGSHEEPFYTLAKNLNYGIPYGIGPRKFALYLVKGLHQPMSEALVRQAATIIDGHRKLWPVTHRGINKLTRFAQDNGYVPMIVPGRFRHFSGWRTTVPGYTAFNAVVQGGVAEIMKLWMVEAEDALAESGAEMVLQVHDSLWIEQPPGMIDPIHELLQEVLDGVNPLSVHLTIDAKRLN